MKWTRFTIHTTVDAVDILSYELDAIGIEGIEIEDHIPLSEEDKQKMFVDILPESEVVDNVAQVSFYIEAGGSDTDSGDGGTEPIETDEPVGETEDSLSGNRECAANHMSGKSVEDILHQIQEILDDMGTYTDIGEGRVTVSATEDKDWINNWKQYFKPFRASDRIAIMPRWLDPDSTAGNTEPFSGRPDMMLSNTETASTESMPEDLLQPVAGSTEPPRILRIDPGIAFGTGSHETTKLCIRAIDRFMKEGDRVLDIGTGSGILSIVSLLLGASFATAIDIDEIAVRVARENFDANDINPDTYELLAGNLLGDEAFVREIEERAGRRNTSTRQGDEHLSVQQNDGVVSGYDLVIANILPDVIVPLTALVPRFLKKNGLYITSGILATREPEVRIAMEAAGFTDIETTPMGEWVSLTGRN